jgi:hypothetical protein
MAPHGCRDVVGSGAPAPAKVHGFLRDVGNWDHAWTDEVFISGEQAAEEIVGQLGCVAAT